MRMIILLIIIFFGADVDNTNAQRRTESLYLKNSIEIYYTIGLTKTKLRRTDVPSSGWFTTLAKLEDNTNPVYGFNYGFEYSRRISKRTSLGLGFGYEEKGEISEPISINNPGNPNSANVLNLYQYKLESYRIPLSISVDGFVFKLFGRELGTLWGGNIIGDVYSKFTAQNYLRFIDSGEQRKGGATEWLFYNKDEWKNFKDHLANGYIRIGIGAFGGCNFDISKHLYTRVTANYTYFTEPIMKHDFLIKGTAWVLGLKISAGVKFQNGK